MIKVLSHASMIVESEGAQLLVDPWLIGSCYWRSWWNYPPVKKETIANLNPKAIYITHVHWDHWHGPSLKGFLGADVEIITHDEPNKRSYRDLKKFGFKKIRVLKHGESYKIGDIKITPYQFGLFLNDSAIVIETPKVKILNANDCKIAGASLRQIKDRHGKFDFAMRSHSSANDRVCYSIVGSDRVFDNPSHYTAAFKLFMDNVKPRYAIPFASNHCHLHKDVFGLNDIINDPFKLKYEIEELGGLDESEIRVMLTGDSWSAESGFSIDGENEKFFREKEKNLNEYQSSVRDVLENYYARQGRSKIRQRTIEKFKGQISSIPKIFRRKLKNWCFSLKIVDGFEEVYFLVEPYRSSIEKIGKESFEASPAQIFMPIDIFNSAVQLNMFHHSAISKRNKYLFSNEWNLRKWEIMNGLLEKVELEVFPLKVGYLKNIFLNYLRRWRELIVYGEAYFLKRRGLEMFDIEEKILRSRF